MQSSQLRRKRPVSNRDLKSISDPTSKLANQLCISFAIDIDYVFTSMSINEGSEFGRHIQILSCFGIAREFAGYLGLFGFF
jgi:hypothetical protein